MRLASSTPRTGRAMMVSLFLCAVLCGCGNGSNAPSTDGAPAPRSEAAIRNFCGDCHAFPEADTYPRHAWPEKVREGFNFYFASLRSDLSVPDVAAVEQYYDQRAPEHLNVEPSSLKVAVAEDSLFAPAESLQPTRPLRGVAHLNVVAADATHPAELLICDMSTGKVWTWLGLEATAQPKLLAECRNPCRIAATDLDGDGQRDYVIADLGSFLPEDHDLGAVWWTRQNDAGGWETQILVDGLGRVADVQPLDADGDGDLDLIVAEFGWHHTGRVLLLRNTPEADATPHFTPELVDDRHGAINVPVADLNGDGHPDFVALIAQEHETVEAFLNRGDGTFERQPIFHSPNPGFGSSGIELCDLDGDGDMDVLFVNGDSLDTPIAKPYHSLRWLENTGSFPFVEHEISRLPGGHCVRAGDLDADGDLDLVVVTLLPGAAIDAHPPGTFESIAWFEQTAPGVFVGHSLERDNCLHAACVLVDWDADGDLDLIVADLSPDPSAERPLTIFRNRTITPERRPAAQ